MPKTPLLIVFTIVGLLIAASATAQDTIPDLNQPRLLSAFFGLDNGIPRIRPALCPNSNQQDGMPVIFSHPIDADTLEADDFRVTFASGIVSTPICAILQPAIDTGENRTVLLIGEFGTAVVDEPILVEVVGEILTVAHIEPVLDFNNTAVDVIPLAAGPEIILAERLPKNQWILDREGSQAQGSGCPSDGTVQVIRVKWTGGITKPDGNEIDDLERMAYKVTIEAADGTTSEVIPFAIGNLNDGDNNHDLCLDTEQTVLSVFFPANLVTDPNDDPNPDTAIVVGGLPEAYLALTTIDGFAYSTEVTQRPENTICRSSETGVAIEMIDLRGDRVIVAGGENPISPEAWMEFRPRLPYVKNSTRYLLFDGTNSCLYKSPATSTTCEGQDCFNVTDIAGYTWLELVEISNETCFPNERGCRGQNVREGYVSITTIDKCQTLTFNGTVNILEDGNGNSYVMHATATATPDLTNPVLPEGWTLEARALDEPLVIYPRGGEHCYYNIVRDNLVQSYHQFEFADDIWIAP